METDAVNTRPCPLVSPLHHGCLTSTHGTPEMSRIAHAFLAGQLSSPFLVLLTGGPGSTDLAHISKGKRNFLMTASETAPPFQISQIVGSYFCPLLEWGENFLII